MLPIASAHWFTNNDLDPARIGSVAGLTRVLAYKTSRAQSRRSWAVNLTRLDLAGNNLSGPIPPERATSPSLEDSNWAGTP